MVEAARYVACDHCGALLDIAAATWLDPKGQAALAAHVTSLAFGSSPLYERHCELGSMLRGATRDSPELRARLDEMHLLFVLLYPQLVPLHVLASPGARARWVHESTIVSAVVRFDAQASEAWSAWSEQIARLGRATTTDELVAVAKEALVACTRAYDVLKAHREVAHVLRAPARHYAKVALRTSFLSIMATLDDPHAYDRVVADVLRDRSGSGEECTRCGAPLPDAARDDTGLVRCSHCAAVVERDLGDPWTRAKLAIFETGLADLHRRGAIDGYEAVLAAFGVVRGRSLARVDAGRVFAFLQRAIPWVAREPVEKAFTLYDSVWTADERPVIAEVVGRLAEWRHDPSRRPSPPPLVTPPFDEEAWHKKSVRLFRMSSPGPQGVVVHALGVAVGDLWVFPSTPIRAEHVHRFFDAVIPEVSIAERLRQLEPLVEGYAGLGPGRLLADVVAGYRR